MSNILKIAGAGVSAAAEPTDADFENTVLLLHGDGTNGAQNNTFLDSSTNNFTITRNGNTTQGTFSPFSKVDGGWGNFFDGSGDSLSNSSVALIAQTTSTFTAEGWIYMTANPTSDSNNSGFITLDGGLGTTNYISFGPRSDRKLYLTWFDGSFKTASSSSTLNLNQWYHIACVVNSNSIQFYVNGVAETMSGTTTLTNRSATTSQFSIGKQAYAAISGYLSNIRVTTTAVYTSGFTPNSPLTNISNTNVLTCQSNRFIDNSSNAYALTRNGDVKVTPFSPFPITTAYSTSVNGGAGYFDGSGDYLTTPTDAAFAVGSVFTIEFWLYPQSYGANAVFIFLGEATGDLQFGLNSGTLSVAASGVAWRLTGSTGPTLNAWNHCVLVRSGTGTNETSIFLNGTRIANGTVTDAWTTNKPAIIQSTAGSSYETQGYMASVRIVKGTAVYDPSQTTITVPTAPLTAISNTSLLTNFTNAGIFDNTGFNALETVGNAQIDTTTKKYGTGSMEFDGTGDYLVAPNGSDFNMGTGDFTIEAWVYLNAYTSAAIFGTTNGATTGYYLNSGADADSLRVTSNASGTWADNITVSAGDGFSLNTWTHIAMVRNGANLTLYKNGISVASTSSASSWNFTAPNNAGYIGYVSNGVSTQEFNGYIDDLRITKGIARYTTTFTPPTEALPDIGA